jgi:hypothetical protein
MFQAVLGAYGLNAEKFKIEPFGSGLINHTWKVYSEGVAYILQEVNTEVFRQPQNIAQNIETIKKYLDQTAPKYLFVAPIAATSGDDFVVIDDHFYRIFPFVENSCSIDFVHHPEQAYHAAKQFGKFTRMLCAFNVKKLKPTIEDFHNLPLRVEQFKTALEQATDERISEAKFAIEENQFKILSTGNSHTLWLYTGRGLNWRVILKRKKTIQMAKGYFQIGNGPIFYARANKA